MRRDDPTPARQDPLFDQFARLVCRPYLMAMHAVRWEGLENMPRTGPVIVAANHQSFYDPVLISTAVPRRINYMAVRYFYDSPVVGRLMRLAGCVPVDQEAHISTAYGKLLRLLRAGRACGIFPEGGRSTDGLVQAPWPGVGALVLASGAPVVPVTIHGAYHAWPWRNRLPFPSPIQVRFGKAMRFGPPQRRQDHARRDEISREIMLAICDGLEALGQPGPAEAGRRSVRAGLRDTRL